MFCFYLHSIFFSLMLAFLKWSFGFKILFEFADVPR